MSSDNIWGLLFSNYLSLYWFIPWYMYK